MRVDYQQAGAVVSNTFLTGPFIKHAKTTHNVDQNEKNLYSLGKQQNESMLKGFWECAVLQTWRDGIKQKTTAVSSEPRVPLRKKKTLSQQGRS